MVRLQKFLADAGVASRRASETIILAGRVQVNGQVVRVLGRKIDPARDQVRVDGREVKPGRKFYLALNKPSGYICSRHDPAKRPAVGDLLPKEWHTLYTVGRLDYDTEGLIFLTNDGEFCLRLTHPRYGVRKRYLATVEGRLEPEVLIHQGQRLQAEKVRLLGAHHSRSLVEVELAEGKYREVRRLFEAGGLTVRHLRRTQIGPIKLGELPVGKWRTLTGPEIKTLLSNHSRPRRIVRHEH
jgi:23S rRNA pseudouridine2605 synthase